MQLKRFTQRGLSLVELMVGITIGLIVSAAASVLAVNQINEHRRLMLETQIQQDLRTAADLLQQELRRAGFRGNAELGVWAPPTGDGSLNQQAAQVASASQFAEMTRTDNNAGRSLTYRYARGAYSATGSVRDNENFGFRWDRASKTLYLMIGLASGQPNWQPITDPDAVKITDFTIDLDELQATDVGDFCDRPCDPPTAGAAACPRHVVRQVRFRIDAEAAHDSRVKRTLTGVERLRADKIVGACPA